MISITCTNCQNVLSIDDAFAGGVCRCQHCGTIQTVPARKKENSVKLTAKAAEGKSPKALFRNDSRTAVAAGSGSGLDDLAEVVASSGLSDGHLRKKPVEARSGWKNSPLLLIVAGGIIALLVLMVVYLLWHGKGNGGSAPAPGAGAAPSSAFSPSGPGEVVGDAGNQAGSAQQSAAGPNCFGVKLSTDTVVYLIDNGSSATRSLDTIKAAVFRSVESLGSGHYFQISFWNPKTASYPAGSDAAAVMTVNIDEARRLLEDTASGDNTDPSESLRKAMDVNPGEIVLITTKAYELDDSLLTKVLTIRGNAAVKIDTIAINGAPDGTVLRRIAEQTGGSFVSVTSEQLKAAAE